MSQLSNILFGPKRDPRGEASGYLDQVPKATGKYYDPVIQRGERSGSQLEGSLHDLLSDPNKVLEKLMSGYTTSGAYNRQKDILGGEIGASAAAGGVAGTPYHQEQQGEMVNKLLSSDMQNYLSNVLGLYDKGLKGESDLYGKGVDASGRQADVEGGRLTSEAGLAFEDAKTHNQSRSNLENALTKLLGQAAGSVFGPLGGATGRKLAESIFGSK